MSREITFYSAWYCPFAQRTWAALEHLELAYDYRETDPYHKSDRWHQLSRQTGQVPVLSVQNPNQSEMLIPGSLRSLDYLDEARGGIGGLFPKDASERAEARYWLDYQGAKIIPKFYRFLKGEPESAAADTAKATMMAGLTAITKAMSETGPYFFGSQPGVVDFALAPFAHRIELLLPHYKDFLLPRSEADWPRFHNWSRAIQAHPAFTATMPERESYNSRLLEFYLPYSQGGGQKDVTEPT